MIELEQARRIRIVGLDVDGVLTDGGIFLGDVAGARHEFKRYDIQDGLGILFLRMAGIIPVIVTGRVSESVRLRAQELGIHDVAQEPQAQKLPAFLRILERHHVSLEEAAFVGDDFPDVPILHRVGIAACVGDAVPEVRALCQVQLTRNGGHGAVREFAEWLLGVRGEWDAVTSRYVAERSPRAEVTA
jgi:3-deoxy-D-manno-octulosonate 8-phosphate phosphatase (KDO 8-P phosphatase)